MSLSLGLTISLSSQSKEGNYSTVKYTLTYSKSSTTYNNNGVSYYINVAGTRVKTSTVKFTKGTTSGTIATGTTNIAHNSDGTHSAITAYAYVGPTGFSPSSASKTSNSLSLTTIPRVSDLSVNKTSIPADGSTTITATATKKSSSFTDTITVKLGSYSKTVTSGTAFTLPLTWNNALPSATSGTATVTVTTKSGSTTIGTKSVTFTVTVPSSVKPTVSSIATEEAVSSVTTSFGNRYVKTLSKIAATVKASGSYGSTISKYSTSLNGVTYSGSAFTSNTLTSSGTLTIKTTVTDSRGRTGTLSKTITVVDYYAPAITDLSFIRINDSGAEDANGTKIKVLVSGKVASVDEQNTISLILKHKAASAAAYTTSTLTPSGYVFTDATVTLSDIEPTTTYELVAELSDKLSTVTYSTSTGVPVISRLAGGKGVRLFGEAENEGFWVGNIDMTITDDEYDELLTLLGGV